MCAGSGATIATLRLATSAIAKVHQWAGHESPCRDQGVRASLKGWGRCLARPQCQAGSPPSSPASAAVALRPPRRPPSASASTWPWWWRCRMEDYVVPRRPPLTWGDVQRWDDGSAHLRDRDQGRWKQGGGMVGRYTRGESAGSALRYL